MIKLSNDENTSLRVFAVSLVIITCIAGFASWILWGKLPPAGQVFTTVITGILLVGTVGFFWLLNPFGSQIQPQEEDVE